MSIATETSRAQAVENQLNNLINVNTTNISNFQVNAISAALTSNAGILQSQSIIMSQNVMAISALESLVASQGSSSTVVSSQITTLQQNQSAESAALTAETVRAQAAETALALSIGQIVIIPSPAQSAAIVAESIRATAAEQVIQVNIVAEMNRAELAEATLVSNVTAETIRAENAEQAIVATIAALSSNEIDAVLSAGILTIGGSAVTTAINIGHSNMTTSVLGNMNVTGIATDANYNDAAFGGYWNGAFGGSSFNADSLCGNVRMFRQGELVTLFFSKCSIQPTNGNQSSTYSKQLPSWAWPSTNIMCPLVVYSNWQVQIGLLTVSNNGTMIMQTLPYPNWSGTAGIATETCVSYLVY